MKIEICLSGFLRTFDQYFIHNINNLNITDYDNYVSNKILPPRFILNELYSDFKLFFEEMLCMSNYNHNRRKIII